MSYTHNFPGLTVEQVLAVLPNPVVDHSDGASIEVTWSVPDREYPFAVWLTYTSDKAILRIDKGYSTRQAAKCNGQAALVDLLKAAGHDFHWND